MDPVVFQMYYSISIFLSSWIVLAYNPFVFTYYGMHMSISPVFIFLFQALSGPPCGYQPVSYRLQQSIFSECLWLLGFGKGMMIAIGAELLFFVQVWSYK